MGPGEGVGSIPDGIGGEGISGTVNGLGLVEGVIGIIGGEAMDIGGGAIGIGGGVIIGIGDIAGGMDNEPEGAIMGAWAKEKGIKTIDNVSKKKACEEEEEEAMAMCACEWNSGLCKWYIEREICERVVKERVGEKSEGSLCYLDIYLEIICFIILDRWIHCVTRISR